MADYNLEEIPGRFLPHTRRGFFLSLSCVSFSFFSFLEAKYEMPDTLATNLTQPKSNARKDHCEFPHNKQRCCLNLKSSKFGKLFTTALSGAQGVKSPGTILLQNAVAFYIETWMDSSFLFKALLAPPLLFLVPLERTLCLQIVMWSVPYYRELSQNADTQPPVINTVYLEKQPLLLEKYLQHAG